MSEAFEGNGVAVAHCLLNGFFEVQYVSQGFSSL